MKTEEDVSESRATRDSDRNKGKRKVRKKTHGHIGPNARAYRAGLAFCPMCDAEKFTKLTDVERAVKIVVKTRDFVKVVN